LRSTHPVGFRLAQASKEGAPPLAVAIWYPTGARPWPTVLIGPVLMDVAKDAPVKGQGLPLIVFSHGNGGGRRATPTSRWRWRVPVMSSSPRFTEATISPTLRVPRR
jgi:hypothetical protein